MRLILIRHGQTAWNDREIFRGRADIPLDPTGKVQARAVARRLTGFHIRKIYSSPLKRALETAETIGEKLHLTPEVIPNLIEIDCGIWQGLSCWAVQKRFPKLYQKWLTKPHQAKIPKGETLTQVRSRLNRMIRTIRKMHVRGDIIIVSHRIILKILILSALTLNDSYFWRIKFDLGGLSILELKDGKFNIILLNDTSHLKSTNLARGSKDL